MKIRLSPVALRLILLAIVALQIAKVRNVELTSFVQSYWFVDYRYGFIRRGLGGTITGQADYAVTAAAYACVLIPVAALLIVLELLVRRRTRSSAMLALLIACSPMCIAELALYRRPDQLGLVLLVSVGLACVYVTRALVPVLGLLAVGLALLVFVHEAALLLWGAAIPLLIFATLDRPMKTRAACVGLMILPAMLAVLLVATFGRVTEQTSSQLREDAALQGPTVFAFLSDGNLDSLDRVLAVGTDKHLVQLTIGVLLVVAHVLWVKHWVQTDWLGSFRRIPAAWRVALAATTAVPIVLIFAVGVDWMRWFSAFTTAGLVVAAFAMLAHQRRDPAPGDVVQLSWMQAAAIAYFAFLSPMPEYEPAIPIPDLDLLEDPRVL